MKMRRILIATIALLLPWAVLAQGSKKNILFVGNSYTEVNNLPQLVQYVALSMGDTISTASNTPGGCTFNQHCTNQSMTLICQGGWDVVVLQEQSQYPSFPQHQVEAEVFPYAERLVDSIYAKNPCAEPMFYMTWGRKDGDQNNAQFFPILGTYEGMDSMLYERYMYMAHENDASVCPVGRVWRSLRTQHPDFELYMSDGSHPSMLGSYAAACAFYTMIFHRDPMQIGYIPNIDPAQAAVVRQTVHDVVYANLSNWTRPEPVADFSSAQGDNLTVNFANNSQHAENYYWDFGDGETSAETNPRHTYSDTGIYTVTLVTTRHCMADTAVKSIEVKDGGQVSIAEVEVVAALTISPNPASDVIRINSAKSGDVRIYDMSGRMVLWTRVEGSAEVDIRALEPGMYVVRMNGLAEKIIKK